MVKQKLKPAASAALLGKLNSVEAVKVAVRLLEQLALARRAMGVTELADRMGETKPRVHRHLSTLREMGLIEQDQATERYGLGWKMFQLGEAAGDQFDLRGSAEPYLVRLRDELRETAVLAAAVNGQPMVICTADNIYARICISVKPGNRPLLHCSALGRVVLAFSPPQVQEQALQDDLQPETPRSMTDKEELRRRIAQVRKRYYDYSDGEVMLGVNTVAVPIFRGEDTVVGALCIVGSIQNIPNPPQQRQIDLLQQFAAELSAQFQSDAYERWRRSRA